MKDDVMSKRFPMSSVRSAVHRRHIAYGIARHLGIPVTLCANHLMPNAKAGVHWTGEILQVSERSEGDLVHEIAHWLVAREHAELALPDWGLEREDYAHYLGDEQVQAREDEAFAVERGLNAAIEAGAAEAALGCGWVH
jgi:hypothetical protein